MAKRRQVEQMNAYTWQKVRGPTGQVLMHGGGVRGLFATEGPGLDPTGVIYAGRDAGAGMQWVKVGGAVERRG